MAYIGDSILKIIDNTEVAYHQVPPGKTFKFKSKHYIKSDYKVEPHHPICHHLSVCIEDGSVLMMGAAIAVSIVSIVAVLETDQ